MAAESLVKVIGSSSLSSSMQVIMHEGHIEMVLKVVGKMSNISLSVNWQKEISDIVGPIRPGDTKDSWLGKAHDVVVQFNKNVSFRQLRDLFQGYVTDPKYSVAISVLSAAEQARLQEAKCDAKKLAGIYKRNADALTAIDADFHQEQIDALVTAARILSGENRS